MHCILTGVVLILSLVLPPSDGQEFLAEPLHILIRCGQSLCLWTGLFTKNHPKLILLKQKSRVINVSDYLLRFAGIGRLYGTKALDAFQKSHVCVVGIGGVGSWAAEALARWGIGEITLIDLDDICISNTNRQLHALTGSVGQDKVAVMAERIKAINPDCKVHQVEDFVTHDNLFELMSNDFDYVVDCIDSIKAKVALIAHCKRNKIAIVTVGGAGGQAGPYPNSVG